jgi:hypothetical protein
MSAIVRPPLDDCVPCRNCGKPVFDFYGTWYHRASESLLDIGGIELQSSFGAVGCRAASFDDNGWDDSLDRSWKARPPK